MKRRSAFRRDKGEGGILGGTATGGRKAGAERRDGEESERGRARGRGKQDCLRTGDEGKRPDCTESGENAESTHGRRNYGCTHCRSGQRRSHETEGKRK